MGKIGRIDITKVIDFEVISFEVSTTIIQNKSRYNDNSETENDDDELELEEFNLDNEETICDKSVPKTNNNNKIPKISDISILD
ncbi:hypothetical protein C1646_760951 [Rhizophagus diaphanus]|nr:hypothetical protein C1646_760951 [Rhizophagus diaphanus] [Rhizophagus sp. MUCL 43196]